MKINKVYKEVRIVLIVAFISNVILVGSAAWVFRINGYSEWIMPLVLCIVTNSMILGAFIGFFAVIKSGLKHNLFNQDTVIPK